MRISLHLGELRRIDQQRGATDRLQITIEGQFRERMRRSSCEKIELHMRGGRDRSGL